ncbi:MAG: lyase family protein, partial [Solirubrobacteraceae bacterium]
MIARYTRPELGALWTDEARMEAWRRVEVAACEAMDGPTAAELDAIRSATFTVQAVQERERVTDHDVAAFVDVLSASAGDAGRWIHFGLTSSDVLDTALALQLRAAGEIVLAGARELVAALVDGAREHAETVCVGRTHGVHA